MSGNWKILSSKEVCIFYVLDNKKVCVGAEGLIVAEFGPYTDAIL